jgi:hypothetical protein
MDCMRLADWGEEFGGIKVDATLASTRESAPFDGSRNVSSAEVADVPTEAESSEVVPAELVEKEAETEAGCCGGLKELGIVSRSNLLIFSSAVSKSARTRA